MSTHVVYAYVGFEVCILFHFHLWMKTKKWPYQVFLGKFCMYKAGLQCKWGIASNVVAQEGASFN